MIGDFLNGLDMADKFVQEGAVKGLTQAGLRVVRDAVMEAPTTPLDEGSLRGSGSVFVDTNLVFTSEQYAEDDAEPTPATEIDPQFTGPLTAAVGFNTPYAAKLHEGVDLNFKEPGAGAKFLERPLAHNGDRYLRIVGKAIRAELGRHA